MEGLSGEGTRRRREYTEDTEVREPTLEDIERAKEQALERIDTSREPEVSAKEYVHQAVREVLEEDGDDEKISRKMGEALQDLKKMERDIERRKEEALERIDLSRREVMEDSSEEQGETGESRFEDIRSQEEREAEMARRKEAILEKLEMREVIDDSLEEIDKTDESHSAEIRTQEEYDRAIERLSEKEVEEGDISRKVEDAIEDLERMERASESTEDKIRDALESVDEKEEDLERKKPVGETSESQGETRESHFGEIRTREEYDQALENHSELKLRKSYESDEKEAVEYFEKREHGEDAAKPTVVKEIENLELRRMYETIHDGPPEVRIESMKDVDDLLEKYPKEREQTGFDERYRLSEVYFEVKDKDSIPRQELAEVHGVSRQFVGFCGMGIEPTQIRRLRELEEKTIVKEWAQSDPEVSSEVFRDTRAIERHETTEKLETHKTVYQVETQVVKETASQLTDTKQLTSENVASVIEKLHRSVSSENCGISYAVLKSEIERGDIRKLEKTIHEHRDEIEKSLSEKFELENVRARVALVNDRLYTWIPKSRPDELVDAYEKQFYYFRDGREIVRVVEDLQNQLGLGDDLYKSLTHVNKVIRQLTAGDEGGRARVRPISEKSTRLEGKTVRFYLDVTDGRLSGLESRVTKVTGINGQAGIDNPRFPEGKELEVLKARLAAIIASDCHLRESGRIGYNEEHLKRIDRVQEILRHFGDITLEPKFRKGVYEVYIQNQIGLMMIHEGMTPGNKTIQNPGLPEGYHNWSEVARRAYLEELIPEDGSFSKKGGFLWSRNHALYDRDANNQQGFRPLITQREIELIIRNGNPTRGLVNQFDLSFGHLERLQHSTSSDVSEAAEKLLQAISDSPNNLIEDEKRIAESLGIKITLVPSCVKYFPKSERVSVKYTATTAAKEDAIRWSEIAPPNDERKRNEVELWLREIFESWLENKEWVDW
jgi:hypothetical protein